jgi:hypothetical protein
MALKPESDAHWYQLDGSPLHEVEKATGGGMRPVTLRDARKLNLLPSVTTIQKEIDKPFLTMWRIEQAIKAALANPQRFDGESEDQHILRISRAANAIVDDAAKRGTLIHEAIEQYINFGSVTEDTVIRPLIEPYIAWHNENVESIDYTEKTVVNKRVGYAGRLDLKFKARGRGRCIVDFKSRKRGSDGKLAIYDENGEQLSAYREADTEAGNERAERCLSIIINSETPDIRVHEWPEEELVTYWQAFQHLVSRWQLLKNYKPAV